MDGCGHLFKRANSCSCCARKHVAALARGIYRLKGCPALYDGGLNPERGVRDLICERARGLHLMGSIEMVSVTRQRGGGGGLRTFEVAAQGPESLVLEFRRFLQTLVQVREWFACVGCSKRLFLFCLTLFASLALVWTGCD